MTVTVNAANAIAQAGNSGQQAATLYVYSTAADSGDGDDTFEALSAVTRDNRDTKASGFQKACPAFTISSPGETSTQLLQFRVLGLGLFQDGDFGRHCGSPTLCSNSANRGSERMGSSKKSVFKPSSSKSRS